MKNLSDVTILLTGGTGFIGKPLCQALVQQGARVVVVSRRPQNQPQSAVTYLGSLSDLKGTQPDVIINLAGEPIAQRWSSAVKEKIRNSRFDATSALIAYMKSCTKKPQLFISGSAIGYYGTDEDAAFDETSTPSTSGGRFSRELCAVWEAEAFKANKLGVRTVLLRIGAVLAKDGGMLGKLAMPFRLGLGGPIGHGRQWLSWIDRDDLINLILYTLRNTSIEGPINATSPNPLSNADFSKTLSATFHKPCLVCTPAFALRLAFGDMADEIMLEGQKVLPRKAMEKGFVFSYPTLAESLRKIFTVEKNNQ